MFLTMLGLAVLVGASASQAMAKDGKAVVWPAAEIKWSEGSAMKGAKLAVLWGDPKVGAYGALKTIPAGEVLRAHTHTHDQRVIVLAGQVVLTIDGQPSKELGPGSYLFVPGGVKHTAGCKAGAECTYFEEQDGPSDVKFVETTAK
jgi:quercetin dioxygenase-like cupin family protein